MTLSTVKAPFSLKKLTPFPENVDFVRKKLTVVSLKR